MWTLQLSKQKNKHGGNGILTLVGLGIAGFILIVTVLFIQKKAN